MAFYKNTRRRAFLDWKREDLIQKHLLQKPKTDIDLRCRLEFFKIDMGRVDRLLTILNNA